MLAVSQDSVQAHLAKTIICGTERLRVRDARVFEYPQSHVNELWVKYSLSPNSVWHKFVIKVKKSVVLSLPSIPAYSSLLELSPNKMDDLNKVVYRFVPCKFRIFYDETIEANVEIDGSPSS